MRSVCRSRQRSVNARSSTFSLRLRCVIIGLSVLFGLNLFRSSPTTPSPIMRASTLLHLTRRTGHHLSYPASAFWSKRHTACSRVASPITSITLRIKSVYGCSSIDKTKPSAQTPTFPRMNLHWVRLISFSLRSMLTFRSAVEVIRNNMAARQNDLRLYLDVIADPSKVYTLVTLQPLMLTYQQFSFSSLSLPLNQSWFSSSTLTRQNRLSMVSAKCICQERARLAIWCLSSTNVCAGHLVPLWNSTRWVKILQTDHLSLISLV